MSTILAVAALAVVFPLIFRVADRLGRSAKVVSALKKIHAL